MRDPGNEVGINKGGLVINKKVTRFGFFFFFAGLHLGTASNARRSVEDLQGRRGEPLPKRCCPENGGSCGRQTREAHKSPTCAVP